MGKRDRASKENVGSKGKTSKKSNQSKASEGSASQDYGLDTNGNMRLNPFEQYSPSEGHREGADTQHIRFDFDSEESRDEHSKHNLDLGHHFGHSLGTSLEQDFHASMQYPSEALDAAHSFTHLDNSLDPNIGSTMATGMFDNVSDFEIVRRLSPNSDNESALEALHRPHESQAISRDMSSISKNVSPNGGSAFRDSASAKVPSRSSYQQSSAELEWRAANARNPNKVYRSGALRPDEQQILSNAIKDYCNNPEHPMTITEFSERLWLKMGNRSREFNAQFIYLLSERRPKNVYNYLRRAYNPVKPKHDDSGNEIAIQKSRWTAEDDNRIETLVAEKGRDWVAIGQILGKFSEDVRDRYRNYIDGRQLAKASTVSSIVPSATQNRSHPDIATEVGPNTTGFYEGAWTQAETDRLLLIMKGKLSQLENLPEFSSTKIRCSVGNTTGSSPVPRTDLVLEPGTYADSVLSWNTISQLQATRSRIQCRDKWSGSKPMSGLRANLTPSTTASLSKTNRSQSKESQPGVLEGLSTTEQKAFAPKDTHYILRRLQDILKDSSRGISSLADLTDPQSEKILRPHMKRYYKLWSHAQIAKHIRKARKQITGYKKMPFLELVTAMIRQLEHDHADINDDTVACQAISPKYIVDNGFQFNHQDLDGFDLNMSMNIGINGMHSQYN